MKKNDYAIIYRFGLCLFASIGLMMHIGIFEGVMKGGSLLYYTVQSNVVVIAFSFYLLIKTIVSKVKKEHEITFLTRIHFILMIDILLTFLVFWVLLAPRSGSSNFPLWTFDNLAVHAITPVLFGIDYFVFGKRFQLKHKDVYLTLIFPLSYVIYTSIIGLSGFIFAYDKQGISVHYPYFFMDYDRVGWLSILYILVLIVIFVSISYGFYAWDHKKTKQTNEKIKA